MEQLNFIFSSSEAISNGSGSPDLISDILTSSSPEDHFTDFELNEIFNLNDTNLHNGSFIQDHEYCIQDNNMADFEQNFDFSTIDTNVFDNLDMNFEDVMSTSQMELRNILSDFSLEDVTQNGGSSPSISEESFQNFEVSPAQNNLVLTKHNAVQGKVILVPVTNQTSHRMQQCTIITKDEQALLTKEGISLPVDVPLTREEEKMLKIVRRKIRNKISAKVSRMKKQSYVEGLEQRVKACTLQNRELQVKVEKLQKQNLTLAEQLKKLQGLLFRPRVTIITKKRQMQAGGCLMVLLLSMALFVLPSMAPWLEDYNSRMFLDVSPSPSSTGRKILQEPNVIKTDYVEEFSTVPSTLFDLHKSLNKATFDPDSYVGRSPIETADEGVIIHPAQYVLVLDNSTTSIYGNFFDKTDL